MKQIRGIWLPDDDDHFEGHLLAGPEFEDAGTYQWKKIDSALKLVHPQRKRVAVDVGAHVGLWSRVLARSFETLIAFEPMPDLAACWLKNMDHIDQANVTLHPQAVGSTPGYLHIVRVQGNSGNCRVQADNEGLADMVLRIPSVTLDDVLEDETVDFLKIDVEGWELHVLAGGAHVIQRDKPLIVVEQKPGHAERYGVGRLAAVDLLRTWGASVLWEKAGDFCVGWS